MTAKKLYLKPSKLTSPEIRIKWRTMRLMISYTPWISHLRSSARNKEQYHRRSLGLKRYRSQRCWRCWRCWPQIGSHPDEHNKEWGKVWYEFGFSIVLNSVEVVINLCLGYSGVLFFLFVVKWNKILGFKANQCIPFEFLPLSLTLPQMLSCNYICRPWRKCKLKVQWYFTTTFVAWKANHSLHWSFLCRSWVVAEGKRR